VGVALPQLPWRRAILTVRLAPTPVELVLLQFVAGVPAEPPVG
jgi:hypothetical protein